ncbi:hypothetical protein Pmani_013418 [Petrolisthes manimaculis]|uniref:THAP-type domain-containing protein n=1 Tax=Petrolisthes manimaculis TaxID=1843537 RepID=A0AAE1UDP0_9EUCA|nr:hypothetical protein Pmani_013418 [Petrolisthes manimaculis]
MRLFRFPRDAERRKIWENKVRRANWSANENHRLCQAHFLDDQFETNRADGWKKLKSTAVPTIFCHRPLPRYRKAPVKHTSDDVDSTTKDVWLGDHTYSMLSVVKPVPKIHMQDAVQFDGYGSSTSACTEPTDSSSTAACIELTDSSTTSASIELTDSSDIPICEEIVVSSTDGEAFWRQQASALAKQVNDTQQQLENLQQTHESLTRQIHHVFNEDQVTALSSAAAGRMRKWSNATVQKSLRIRFSCGTRGYDDLIEHGFPMPSLRTLRRHITMS